MSFRFNETLFRDDQFNDKIKQKLTKLLTKSLVNDTNSSYNDISTYYTLPSSSSPSTSSSSTTSTNTTTTSRRSPNFLKDEIKITKVDFPTIPQVEILDMDITTEPRSLIKTIGNISCSNAFIQLETIIESNLLMSTLQTSPTFITPNLISNNSFKIPITMTFSNIQLEAITNVFMRNHGVSISFNDVSLDFKFDCSIKLLQSTIEKRLKDSIYSIFKEVLPTAIFNTSQHWFNQREKFEHTSMNSGASSMIINDKTTMENKIILDENDLQDISMDNMSRLSSIISSRDTLSLHGTNYQTLSFPNNFINFTGCLERQNLYRFISTMPSLQNFYHSNNNSNNTKQSTSETHKLLNNNTRINCTSNNENENFLPQDILDSNVFKLNDIITIQNKLFERNYHNSNNNIQPKKRTIKLKKLLKKKLKQEQEQGQEQEQEQKEMRDTSNVIVQPIPSKPLTQSIAIEHESLGDKLSPRVKEMNKLVDSIFNNSLIINSKMIKKSLESPIPSPTLTQSMGLAGLNPYKSLWGYQNNLTNVTSHNMTSTINNTANTTPHRRLPTPIQPPSISPPPYSLAKY